MLNVKIVKEKYIQLRPYTVELLDQYKQTIEVHIFHLEEGLTDMQIKRIITKSFSEPLYNSTKYLYVLKNGKTLFLKDLQKNRWLKIKD